MLEARPAVRSLAASRIREVVNSADGVSDVLAFWVGEPDEPTPEFIRKAGMDSIAAGETFYTYNLGIPSLRSALAYRKLSGASVGQLLSAALAMQLPGSGSFGRAPATFGGPRVGGARRSAAPCHARR